MNGARGWPLLSGQGPRASKAVIRAHTRLAHLQGYLAHKKTHPLGGAFSYARGTSVALQAHNLYRGTSRNRSPVGPYSRTMPRLIWRS